MNTSAAPLFLIVVIFIFTLGAILLRLWLNGHWPPKLELTAVEFEKLKGEDAIVTLSDGRRFRGCVTVWHRWPSGKRASTDIERICCDEWTRQMWKVEDGK